MLRQHRSATDLAADHLPQDTPHIRRRNGGGIRLIGQGKGFQFMALAQSPAPVVSDSHVPNIPPEQSSDHDGVPLLARRVGRRSAVAMLCGTGLTLAAGGRMAAAQEDPTAESGTNQDSPTDESVTAPGDSASGSGNGQAIADYAMQFLGDAYVYAGNQPGGFDCSGFTEYVILNTLGIDIGHGTAGQTAFGSAVEWGSWLPGDLVFFADTFEPGISHVGIAIGGSQMIHAENESTGVTISDITSEYYASHYYSTNRL